MSARTTVPRLKNYSQQCAEAILRALPEQSEARDLLRCKAADLPTLRDLSEGRFFQDAERPDYVGARCGLQPFKLHAAGAISSDHHVALDALLKYGRRGTLAHMYRGVRQDYPNREWPEPVYWVEDPEDEESLDGVPVYDIRQRVALFVRLPGVPADQANIVLHNFACLRWPYGRNTSLSDSDEVLAWLRPSKTWPDDEYLVVERRRDFVKLLATWWSVQEGFVDLFKTYHPFTFEDDEIAPYDLRRFKFGEERDEQCRFLLSGLGHRPTYEVALRDLSGEELFDTTRRMWRKVFPNETDWRRYCDAIIDYVRYALTGPYVDEAP